MIDWRIILHQIIRIIILIMQQDSKQSDWDKILNDFGVFLQQTVDFLQLLSTKGIKKLGLYRYPIDNYIRAWKSFTTSYKKRLQSYLKDNKLQVIISTCNYWQIPSWISSYNDIYLFSKNCLEGEQKINFDQGQLESVAEELKIKQKFGFGEITGSVILRLPFYFLECLMEKQLQIAIKLQVKLQQQKKELVHQSSSSFKKRINCLRSIQLKQLQHSISQLNQALQFLNKPDSASMVVNRDNSVLKYNFILKQYDPVDKSKRKFILRYIYRIKLISRWRKLDKKRQERLKDRRMNILQLIDGQEKYIKGLVEYITCLKDPIEKLEVLNQMQQRKLFSSIVEIKDFHEAMYSTLKGQFETYTNQKLFAPILNKFIPFFKLYTDYILNAQSAQKFLQQLMRTNKQISQICKLYTTNTHKLAQNELLQPTFRIARYEMLFQQIIKKTSPQHKDYQLFIDVQAKFKKILTQVNDEVDKIIRRMRMNQLQQQFSTPDFQIFNPNREYLNEYQLTLIKQPKPQQVILIVFNDLILIIEEASKKLLRKIPITQQFFARRQQDNKIYRNMITIHDNGFTTFTPGSDDVFANKAEEVYLQLKKITKQTAQLAYVSVLGTEEIGSTSFKKYTEYIIEVRYLQIKKLLHLRFSSISNIVTDLQRHYKDNLKITEQDCLNKNWLNSHKSKIIEARKLIIGQIFQKLFNHELIKKDPEYFLKSLSLPTNFYDIARTSYEKRISLSQSVTFSGLKKTYLTKKEQKQAFTILCGTEIKLGRDLFHDNQNDQGLKKLKDMSQKIEIQVQTLFEQDPIIITITDYDTVQDVCNKVSKLIGLRSNRDFRLFHQIGKKQLRVLDHQQFITKIFTFPKKKENLTFSEKLLSITKSFYSTVPILIFKKYYYLPFQIQLAEVRKDLIRLRLLVYQIFSQIKEMKYQLTFDEYVLFLSMYFYIYAEGKTENVKADCAYLVHKVIPQTIFKLKNLSEKQWLEKCQYNMKRIGQEIEKVIIHNNDQVKNHKIKADTVSKRNLYFGHKYLCSQIVLNKIRTNPIFGSNLFYVQPHSVCYKKLQQSGLKVAYNMWLAVKVESVNLLSPSSKQTVLELKYEDIGKTEVFSQSIVFKTSSAIEEEYRLNTYQSFQISQLVKYNKSLNEVLHELKDDSGLNSRVKLYRDQLMQYRTTYEQENSQFSMIR